MIYRVWVVSLSLLFLTSCSSFNSLFKDSEPISKAEQEYIDSLMRQPKWEVPEGTASYPEPRTWDLIHQNAELRVDLMGTSVKGFTELYLVNRQSNNRDSLVLDAGGIKVYAVRDLSGNKLEFSHDSCDLTIYPHKPVEQLDTAKVAIRYQTGPSGSLRFINTSGQEDNAEPQIWTRSDFKRISEWLPTITRPNEKATVDLWISVPDFLETVASGRLMERKVWSGDSLRTDHWRITDPVPIHDIGWAAGEFSSESDTYNDKVIKYYTMPGYEEYIPLIYSNTENILNYLQKATETTFTYDAYHLIPLQLYPSRGEALSSALFLFEKAQYDARAAQDVNNLDLLLNLFSDHILDNRIVYDDWAYAGLKEGLKRQLLYMYYEQALNNPAEAHYLRNQHYKEYFKQADTLRKPLVFRSYSSPSDLMDAHGYYKSAAFWYMLQQRVGEEAFLDGLQSLLHSPVSDSEEPNFTRDDLIRVFERVSGGSLQRFFEQWLGQPGHPTVAVKTSQVNNQLLLTFEQLQKKPQPVFDLRTKVEIVTDSSRRSIKPLIQTSDTTFKYQLNGELQDVVVDPNGELLVEWKQKISKSQALHRLKDERAAVRLDAIQQMSRFEWDDSTQKVLMDITSNDNFAPVRQSALQLLSNHIDAETKDFVTTRTYETETDARVRIAALHAAAKDTVSGVYDYLKSMTRDTSYFVAAEAVKLFARKYPGKAYPYIREVGLNSSYRDVIKAGFAQGLRHIDRDEARKDLYRMASESGYDQYIRDAMESLAYHIRNSTNSEWRGKIIDLYVDQSNSRYPGIRKKAGNLLESFQSRPEGKESPASTNGGSS